MLQTHEHVDATNVVSPVSKVLELRLRSMIFSFLITSGGDDHVTIFEE